MKPQKVPAQAPQTDLFAPLLQDIINPAHPLVALAAEIEWAHFDEVFDPLFCADNGRPAKPTRLIVALHYLKYTHDLSDEELLAAWVENPYWQYFCGESHFQHRPPINSSSMTVWRRRLKEEQLEEMLAETIRAGLRLKLIKPAQLRRANVDTTTQEKDIRHPTDSRLYDRSRQRLVAKARKENVKLRQSYKRKGRQALLRQAGYSRSKKQKQANREQRKLKTYLGRVARDIERKCPAPSASLRDELQLAHRLLDQRKDSKNKLYSLHEPETACLSKGKPHKKYEFGSKAGFVTCARGNWIVGAMAFEGGPHDSKTLKKSLEQADRIVGRRINQATVDLGYRGHGIKDRRIIVADRFRKTVSESIKRWWRRRSAIEPIIGHMKEEHRLDRCRLKGRRGDHVNAVMSACAFNFRKLLRGLSERAKHLFLRLFALLLPLLAVARFIPPFTFSHLPLPTYPAPRES